MRKVEDVAAEFFDKSLSDRERAIFEGGIALGAIYHQFIGIPVNRNDKILSALKKAIEETMSLQPYREKVEVEIRSHYMKKGGEHPYNYEALKSKHLDVKVVIRYGDSRATVRMKYIPELDFNLMYVESIEKTSG